MTAAQPEDGARAAGSAATGASARLSRLLALVPYLLARPGSRVEDVAEAFGISEQRLLDDLQLLFVCGLPGHLPDDLIEASFEGGVIHLSNADTIARPLRLGADEALALLVGLRALASVPGGLPLPAPPHEHDVPDRPDHGSAVLERTLAKLERAAGDAAELASSVAVEVEAEDAVLPVVNEALARRRRLHLTYYVPGRDETTERDVDPMRLLLVDGRAYLEAWCRRAEDVRLFRLDRVVAVSLLDAAAEVPPEARGRDVGGGLFRPSPDDAVVTLDLAPEARWVAEYYPVESAQDRPDGALRVVLRAGDPRWVPRLVLRLGGSARVVAPDHLAEEVRRLARESLAAYGEQPTSS